MLFTLFFQSLFHTLSRGADSTAKMADFNLGFVRKANSNWLLTQIELIPIAMRSTRALEHWSYHDSLLSETPGKHAVGVI